MPPTFAVFRRAGAAIQSATASMFAAVSAPVPATGTNRLLVLATSQPEHRAVADAIGVTRNGDCRHPALRLGRVADVDVLLSGDGSGFADRPALVSGLLRAARPDTVVLTGPCFGPIGPEQRTGDVLVPTELRLLRPRWTDGWRAPNRRVMPSATLLSACRAAVDDWQGTQVHFGPAVSGSMDSDSLTFRACLISEHPDALAGEPNDGQIVAAAARALPRWLVMRSVCDWGTDGTGRSRAHAAANVAGFLVHVVRSGGLTDARTP
ncbi:hypothetical protein Dvina_04220 [Dactylosporangium vinaceum]|uniref:Nucleoside phosphorylase domain-containing protein n=1 Tax=Dactylosporangium vinaceum TaxID=53362 RepID=A0ABV5M0G2_9ACTN|nr:hypothetical protein [Dactylosporangium vinaceum]UAB97392.1 hypothetical protein Dvina_04220 [Dactylosporangium vinaceum]